MMAAVSLLMMLITRFHCMASAAALQNAQTVLIDESSVFSIYLHKLGQSLNPLLALTHPHPVWFGVQFCTVTVVMEA
jgi:hypothetical protein